MLDISRNGGGVRVLGWGWGEREVRHRFFGSGEVTGYCTIDSPNGGCIFGCYPHGTSPKP